MKKTRITIGNCSSYGDARKKLNSRTFYKNWEKKIIKKDGVYIAICTKKNVFEKIWSLLGFSL